jgi:hypothetical protein
VSAIQVLDQDFSGWVCAACGQALELRAVDLEYLGSRFDVELPACPACGLVLIPESLALGKMAEVEKILEDK